MIITNLACLCICLLQALQLQAQETYLLLANRPFVQRINLNGSGLQSIFQDNESSIVGLDADIRMEKVFWSDTIKKTIIQANIDGSGSQTILNTDIGKIEGLAWDWINKKLYWTDEDKKTIEVMDPASGYRKVLARYTDGTKPRAIAVDPQRGWLYWSDWNASTAKIVRMSMDGSTSTVLFDNRTVIWPDGLTLDYETETLYWIDAKNDYIGKSKTDGSDFVTVQNLTNDTVRSVHAFAIDFHDGHLFWTDWLTDSLFTLRDGAPEGSVELVNKLGNDPCEIHIIDSRRQPMPDASHQNPCDDNNGGCSHLCLLSSRGYSCVCPDGVDTSTCNNGTEGTKTTISTTQPIFRDCTEFPCLNGGTCYQLSESFVCQCAGGFIGRNCGIVGSAGGLENQFSVSGVVFLGVVGALLGVILIMTFIIVVIVLVSMKLKYEGSKGRNHSVIDNSPRDSPTHVVVGRLSDHDYISIKSRESPAPRGIVINIENLGGNGVSNVGRSSPNQYTIHKGIRSSVASNLSIQNGIRPPSGDSSTAHMTSGNSASGLLDMMSRVTPDSDNDSELNILQSRHEQEGNHSHDGVSMV